KQYNKAIKYYNLRLQKKPNDSKVILALNKIYETLGNKNKALQILVDFDKNYSKYKIKKKIAEAFEEKNDLQNAIKYYSEAFEINNKKVDILEKIALMYHNIGQDTSAIKIYNNYIATQPEDYILRKVYKNLGIFYQGLGDEENAIIAFENSYHIKNDEEIGLILAQIYYERGNYSKAKNKLAEVQKNDQNNPQAHYYLGLIYRKDGKINKALAEFEKIKNHPQLGASAKKQIEYIKSTYTIKRTDDLQVHYDSGKKGLQEKKTETYTKKRSDELQVLYDSGLLKKFKIDYNEAWVNPFLWNSLDYDTKVGIGITLAKICDQAGSTGRITFYNNNSGKKLAKYSQSFGFKNY
ncbi:MAG: tetratricopeptide repeat protein, partial [Candidatus Cloacimonetes bacterium]|nr:tetratricopeptide repeat protein [Candidatus Cloacimonadota bacterium]